VTAVMAPLSEGWGCERQILPYPSLPSKVEELYPHVGA
jgi:hypothetical protein